MDLCVVLQTQAGLFHSLRMQERNPSSRYGSEVWLSEKNVIRRIGAVLAPKFCSIDVYRWPCSSSSCCTENEIEESRCRTCDRERNRRLLYCPSCEVLEWKVFSPSQACLVCGILLYRIHYMIENVPVSVGCSGSSQSAPDSGSSRWSSTSIPDSVTFSGNNSSWNSQFSTWSSTSSQGFYHSQSSGSSSTSCSSNSSHSQMSSTTCSSQRNNESTRLCFSPVPLFGNVVVGLCAHPFRLSERKRIVHAE